MTADEFRNQLKKLMERAKSVDTEKKKLDKDIADYKKKIVSFKPEPFKLPHLVKAYMDAVKHTNGLTSARPSCTTAVQAAEKDASVANLEKVQAALGKHADDALKEAGSDQGKKKTATTFKTELDKIVKKLGVLKEEQNKLLKV